MRAQTRNRKEHDMTKTYEYAGVQMALVTARRIALLEVRKAAAEGWVRHYTADMEALTKRADAMRAQIANEETARANFVNEHNALGIEWDHVEELRDLTDALWAAVAQCMEEYARNGNLRDEYAAMAEAADRAIAALFVLTD